MLMEDVSDAVELFGTREMQYDLIGALPYKEKCGEGAKV